MIFTVNDFKKLCRNRQRWFNCHMSHRTILQHCIWRLFQVLYCSDAAPRRKRPHGGVPQIGHLRRGAAFAITFARYR